MRNRPLRRRLRKIRCRSPPRWCLFPSMTRGNRAAIAIRCRSGSCGACRGAVGPDAVAESPVLIQSARYTAHVGRDVEQARYVVTELDCRRWNCSSCTGPLAPRCRSVSVRWMPAGGSGTLTAMIDGRMIDVETTPGGQSIISGSGRGGAARLELTLRPAAVGDRRPRRRRFRSRCRASPTRSCASWLLRS